MAAQLALRERKKLETYRALSAAARRLTLERGLEAVTIDDIAQVAGVSPRTFFNYFSSKEQAIVGGDPVVLTALGDALAARPATESPLDAIAAVLVADAEHLNAAARSWVDRTELVRRYPSLLPRHMAGMIELEHVLARALAERLGIDARLDPYPTVVVASAVAVLRSTMAWWHENDQPVSLADALRDAFTTLASGMTPPAVERRIPSAAATGGEPE